MSAREKNYEIQFKVGVATVTELLALYETHYGQYNGYDAHEQLLAAHIVDMTRKLRIMERNMGNKATLSLTLSEAVAFYQYWQVTDTSIYPLVNVIVCDMIKKIDKRSKAPMHV